MEPQKKPVDRLIQDVKDYIIIQRKLAMALVAKKGSEVVFVIVLIGIMLVLASYFVLILSFALSYLIGSLIGSTWLGFLIVAFLYLATAAGIFLGKNILKNFIFKLFYKTIAPKLKDQDYE